MGPEGTKAKGGGGPKRKGTYSVFFTSPWMLADMRVLFLVMVIGLATGAEAEADLKKTLQTDGRALQQQTVSTTIY